MELDLALLILRLVIGGLLAAHGAQKLFGSFGGPGLSGTTGWLASMGVRPAALWAWAAALSEFGGGVLIALGLLTPLAGLAVIAAMLVAIVLVHWKNGLWATKGGYELNLVILAAALALVLTGPGAYSVDAALDIVLSPVLVLIGAALILAGVAMAVFGRRSPAA